MSLWILGGGTLDIAFCFAVLRGTGPSFLYSVLFVYRMFYFLFYIYKMVTSKVSEADVPRLQADVDPSSLRYVCLDFETNGFPEKRLQTYALVFVPYPSEPYCGGKR